MFSVACSSLLLACGADSSDLGQNVHWAQEAGAPAVLADAGPPTAHSVAEHDELDAARGSNVEASSAVETGVENNSSAEPSSLDAAGLDPTDAGPFASAHDSGAATSTADIEGSDDAGPQPTLDAGPNSSPTLDEGSALFEACLLDMKNEDATSCNLAYDCPFGYVESECEEHTEGTRCSCRVYDEPQERTFSVEAPANNATCEHVALTCVTTPLEPLEGDVECLQPNGPDGPNCQSRTCLRSVERAQGLYETDERTDSIYCETNDADLTSCSCWNSFDLRYGPNYAFVDTELQTACALQQAICWNGVSPSVEGERVCAPVSLPAEDGDELPDDDIGNSCRAAMACSTAIQVGDVQTERYETYSVRCSTSGTEQRSCRCTGLGEARTWQMSAETSDPTTCDGAIDICGEALQTPFDSPPVCQLWVQNTDSPELCNVGFLCLQQGEVSGTFVESRSSAEAVCTPNGAEWDCACEVYDAVVFAGELQTPLDIDCARTATACLEAQGVSVE